MFLNRNLPKLAPETTADNADNEIPDTAPETTADNEIPDTAAESYSSSE